MFVRLAYWVQDVLKLLMRPFQKPAVAAGKWLWNTSPLWFIGVALAIQLGVFRLFPEMAGYVAPVGAALFVMLMAYAQNWSYALSSRSAMRNSNAYHLLAALVGSFTFFVTFRYLMLRNMPGTLFLSYLFATVLGSIHGQTISMFIEKKLKLDVIATKVEKTLGIHELSDEEKKEAYTNQFFRFWPCVIALLFALVAQISWLHGMDGLTVGVVALAGIFMWQLLRTIQGVIAGARGLDFLLQVVPVVGALVYFGLDLYQQSYATFMVVSLLLMSMPDSFLHAVLRVARSSDHYWYHLTASLMKMGFSFLQLMILFELQMDWSLFLPMATGGMIGSLTGSTFAAKFAKKIDAGFDEHVKTGRDVGWPRTQLYSLIIVGVIAHLVAFWLYEWQGVLVLLGLSFLQTMSFTLISRARQRKNKQYHAWASVCSNGIWYLAMNRLVFGDLQPFQAAPYVVGNASGSLIGQGTALKVEKLMGAVMVEKEPQKPKAEVVPFPNKEKAS